MSREQDKEALDQVLNELDRKAQDQHVEGHSTDYWVCQRRHPRYGFRTDCTIRFICLGTFEVLSLPGRTRNLSRGGIGVIVRRAFSNGDPVEIELKLPNRQLTFMAGLVQFARYAGRGYHELGVSLRIVANNPLFSHNPVQAIQSIAWLHEYWEHSLAHY